MAGSNHRINHQFHKLELKKDKLMSQISSLPEEIYNQPPIPGSWSVAQAANHIFLSEQLSLAYLKKKLSYPDTVPRFHFKSWVAVLLLKFSLGTPFKVKAPKTIDMWQGQTIYAPSDLDHHWKLLRTALLHFVEEQYPSFGTHLAYNHPFAGRMTMYQMLIFFNDHMAHHMRQIDRILEKVK